MYMSRYILFKQSASMKFFMEYQTKGVDASCWDFVQIYLDMGCYYYMVISLYLRLYRVYHQKLETV